MDVLYLVVDILHGYIGWNYWMKEAFLWISDVKINRVPGWGSPALSPVNLISTFAISRGLDDYYVKRKAWPKILPQKKGPDNASKK